MTKQKLRPYLEVARAIGSDDFYQMLFSKLPSEDHLPKTFNEEEVLRFLRMTAQSSDRKLEMISVWAESKKNLFNNADSIFNVFRRFLGIMDATKLSKSAINKFMWSESLFSLNSDCR